MKVLVSGLLNIETTVKVNNFPVEYSPIEYSFYGVNSSVSGVAYNVAKAVKCLGNKVFLISMLGNDLMGECVLKEVNKNNISDKYIFKALDQTPTSVVMYDDQGKRKIYCDLKNIQEMSVDVSSVEDAIKECDIAAICNSNMNRKLLKSAKEYGKIIATDVHVLSNVDDEYNKEFMEYADILFLSDEALGDNWRDMILSIREKYDNNIIVMGRGNKGAAIYVRKEDKIYEEPAVSPERIVNTVGAGDALFSSFVSCYSEGMEPRKALHYAQTFAANKIGYDGAAIGFLSREELEKKV